MLLSAHYATIPKKQWKTFFLSVNHQMTSERHTYHLVQTLRIHYMQTDHNYNIHANRCKYYIMANRWRTQVSIWRNGSAKNKIKIMLHHLPSLSLTYWQTVFFFWYFSSTSTRGRGSKVKVEMQRLYMTQENQDMVRETLLSLQVPDDGDLPEWVWSQHVS